MLQFPQVQRKFNKAIIHLHAGGGELHVPCKVYGGQFAPKAPPNQKDRTGSYRKMTTTFFVKTVEFLAILVFRQPSNGVFGPRKLYFLKRGSRVRKLWENFVCGKSSWQKWSKSFCCWQLLISVLRMLQKYFSFYWKNRYTFLYFAAL